MVIRVSKKQRSRRSVPSAAEKKINAPGNPYSYTVQGYHPAPAAKPKQRGKTLFIILLIVLSAVFVYASVQLILYFVQSHQAKQEEQMIKTLIVQSEALEQPDVVPTDEPTEAPAALAATEPPVQIRTPVQPETPDVLIQFQNALVINPDTVGQLQMGESIHTYVVQRDNSYYLRHSFSDEYSFSGAIFLDVTCSIYPQSRNLIIHGHNMQDGTAFGKLSRFDSIAYLNKYPFIEFSTLYENARYVPFAAVYYSIDPQSELYLDIYRINAMSDAEFTQFVSKLQQMSEYLVPVYVSGTDKILTVTTCATNDEDMRFAVFAVKRSDI